MSNVTLGILAGKGGQQVESSKTAVGKSTYKIAKLPARPSLTLLPVLAEGGLFA